MRIAVIFHRFGPYHCARLEAMAQWCNVYGYDLYGIETSSNSKTYAWNSIQDKFSFERITVYSEGDIQDLPRFQNIALIQSTLAEICPDVVAVYGWGFTSALAATAWCVRTKTPSIVMSESAGRDFTRSWWKEALKRRVIRTHQAGLVGGQRHKTYLSELGMPVERIRTGYDVVDNQFFSDGAAEAQEQSSSLRRQLQLPEHYFLASSRFVRKKNLHRLFDAYSEYRDQTKRPWDLVLLGDGPLKDVLLAHRDKLNLNGYIHLPGFKQYEELPAYYGMADAFVHASTREQWGLVINEAMAAGLPILASEECGCVPDLVRHGENGFIFDPYAPNEIAEYMSRLSQSSDLDAMGACSKDLISLWTPDTFAKKILETVEIAQKKNSVDISYADILIINSIMYLV